MFGVNIIFEPKTLDNVFEDNDFEVLAPCLLNSTIHNSVLVFDSILIMINNKKKKNDNFIFFK